MGNRCSRCSNELNEWMSFCPGCGLKLNKPDDTKDEKPEKAEEEKVLFILKEKYKVIHSSQRDKFPVIYRAYDEKGEPAVIEEITPVTCVSGDERETEAALFNSRIARLTKLKHSALPTIRDSFVIREDTTMIRKTESSEEESIKEYKLRCFVVINRTECKTFDKIISSLKDGRLPEVIALDKFIMIADAVNFLHSQIPPVILGSIKPSNVALADDGSVHFVHFGEDSLLFSKKRPGKTVVSDYSPPELIRGIFNEKGDIYSLGVTFHHLLTGIDPRDNPERVFSFKKLADAEGTFSSQMEKLISSMLEMDPDKRPKSVEEVINVLKKIKDSFKESTRKPEAVSPAPVLPRQPKPLPKQVPPPLPPSPASSASGSLDRPKEKPYRIPLPTEKRFPSTPVSRPAVKPANKPPASPGKTIGILAVVGFILIVTVFLAVKITEYNRGRKALQLIGQAEEEINRGSFREAEKLLEKSIELESTPEAWYLKGICLYRRADYQGAISNFDKSMEIFPVYKDALIYKGLCYQLLNDQDRALVCFTKEISNRPRNPRAYAGRGYSFILKNNLGAAKEDLDNALSIDPDNSQTYVYLGLYWDRLDNAEKSLQNYKLAIEKNPDNPDAYDGMTKHLLKRKKYAAGLKNINQALELYPDFIPYYRTRIKLYKGLEQYEDAIDDLTKIIQIDKSNPRDLLERGKLYYKISKLKRADKDFNDFLRSKPKLGEGYYFRANNYIAAFEYEKAIADLNRAIEIDPGNYINYSVRAACYYDLYKYEEAVEDYTKAIKRNRNDAKLYVSRGYCYSYLKKYNKALWDFRKSLEFTKKDPDVYEAIGDVYYELKKIPEAISNYTKAIRLNSTNKVWVLRKRGLSYQKKGQYKHAIRDYTYSIRMKPGDYQGFYSRGIAYTFDKQFGKALYDLNKTLELSPDFYDAYYFRGLIKYKQGKYHEAIADLTKYIYSSKDFDFKHALLDRARCYVELKNYSAARDDLVRFLSYEEKNPEAHFYLALCCEKLKLYSDALNEYRSYIRYYHSGRNQDPWLFNKVKERISYFEAKGY